MATYDQLRQELSDRPTAEGVTAIDIAELPEPLRTFLKKALRVGVVSLAEVATDLGLDRGEARRLAALAVEKGWLVITEADAGGDSLYRVNLSRRKGRGVPVNL
jgi:hypothetical protein